MFVPTPPPIPVCAAIAFAVCVASGGALGCTSLADGAVADGAGWDASKLMSCTSALAMLETISSPKDSRASATEGVVIAGNKDV